MDIYVGADISKGYADFAISDGEGQIRKELQLDDTRRGHDRAIRLMRELNKRAGKEEELVVGMEATGGMEANWLQLFEDLSEELDLTVYRLNALVLRKFAEQQLHGGKTDRISARRIAAFLRRGSIEEHHPLSETGAEPGLRTLSRKTMGMIEESVELKNELHALLQRAHPEMVQHVRGDLSQWVLRLLKNYPTPDQLFEAGPEELAEIPYVTEEKAQGLVENARTSVASQTDEETGLALSLTAEDLLRLERRIDRLKERLWNRIKDQRAPRLLESIEGIGKWGATVLYLEIGDITRFDSVAQLVAFAGLDPQWEESGDQTVQKSISKQGNRRIRSILYSCAISALTSADNPPVQNLYERLREKGKHKKVAEIACMRKLLAIVYGCWTNGQRFDPGYEKRLKARQKEKSQDTDSETKNSPSEDDPAAPVSRREAKRRRKATSPQKSDSSSDRGQGAFP
jgi:transposase